MKKSSGSSKNLGSFLSPRTPNYIEKNNGIQKGWSSERVLQPAGCSRRLTPFSSGRTMPSKWDDAERWICSPVLGQANSTSSQRRPKSKSGPIVPPGTAYYSNYYSPAIPLRQGLLVRNLMVGSPFTTGVLAPDALPVHHFDAHDAVFSNRWDIGNVMQCSASLLHENGVAALSSVNSAPMWSELLYDPSSPNSQDENRDGTKVDTVLSPLSNIEKGTQMSSPETEDNAHSSPTLAIDQKNGHSNKLEVRDVEVDSQATVIRRSKSRATRLNSPHSKDLKEINTEAQASCLDIADSTLDITKIQREEAKIVAWESLQKAKAEAAIRKLEMKLEKKRSSSMDKILKKQRRAQMKAEKMRSLITPVQQQQQQQQGRRQQQQQQHGSSKKPRKVISLIPKYVQNIWSPSRCFSTHSP